MKSKFLAFVFALSFLSGVYLCAQSEVTPADSSCRPINVAHPDTEEVFLYLSQE